jgi:hypothetical protein
MPQSPFSPTCSAISWTTAIPSLQQKVTPFIIIIISLGQCIPCGVSVLSDTSLIALHAHELQYNDWFTLCTRVGNREE